MLWAKNDADLDLVIRAFSEAVRHTIEARKFLRETISVNVIWMHPATSPAISLLNNVTETLILAIREQEYDLKNAIVPSKSLGITMFCMEKVDYQTLADERLPEFDSEIIQKFRSDPTSDTKH